MSYITVGNKVITSSVESILLQLRKESNGNYFKDIIHKGNQLCITCPSHKGGQENHPSCYITDDNTSDINGVWHCFTCNASGNLVDLVSLVFNYDIITATDWLIERFGDTFLITEQVLPEIVLDDNSEIEVMDESILNEYNHYHPYMFKRGLTEDVIRKFKIGSTPDGKYITFPFWDEHDRLLGVFKRSTEGKQFFIPKNIKKPIYLLNFIIKEHITTVYVVESQINALTLWGWGYPAIALIGTGSKEQYERLKKCGVRHFILCLDGDIAGDGGAKRFQKYMPDDVLVSIKSIPRGKDVNDLTKKEFDSLIIS